MKTILQFYLTPDKKIGESENRAIAIIRIPTDSKPLYIGVVNPVDDWPTLFVGVDEGDCGLSDADELILDESMDGTLSERRFEMIVNGEYFDPEVAKYRATVVCSNGERVLHVMELKGEVETNE